jgi:hypothetical protein
VTRRPAHTSKTGGKTPRRPDFAQELVKHHAEKPCGNVQKQSDLYSKGSASYDDRDRRPQSPSQEHVKETRRQPGRKPAEPDLITERQRLVALIARMPDEALAEVFSAVEATLQQAARCAKSAGRVPRRDVKQPLAEFRLTKEACSKTRCANGKLKHLPKLEAPLRWPTKQFSKEYHRHGTSIEQFLSDEWSELVEAGYGELRWLRMVDPSAATAVENYERIDPKTKKRKQLPSDVRFLRERQVTDVKLAMGLGAVKHDPRLLETILGRLRRGKPVIVP